MEKEFKDYILEDSGFNIQGKHIIDIEEGKIMPMDYINTFGIVMYRECTPNNHRKITFKMLDENTIDYNQYVVSINEYLSIKKQKTYNQGYVISIDYTLNNGENHQIEINLNNNKQSKDIDIILKKEIPAISREPIYEQYGNKLNIKKDDDIEEKIANFICNNEYLKHDENISKTIDIIIPTLESYLGINKKRKKFRLIKNNK